MLKKNMVSKILKDPVLFSKQFFTWFPFEDSLHAEWLDLAERFDRLMIVAPRCHGKTTVLSIFYPIFKLSQDFTRRIKVLSCSDDRARDIVFGILKAIQSAGLHKRGMRILRRKSSRRRIYIENPKVAKDASVEAMGVLSMTEGARADIVICDDVVSSRNSATPGLRQLVKDAFYNCVTNMVEPKGKIIYVATIWHAEDLTSELLASPIFEKRVYSIDENFTPLWEKVWNRERLIQRCIEIGQRRFDLGFRNIPIQEKELVFDPDAIELCKVNFPEKKVVEERIRTGEWQTFCGVDLASSGGYNAICVIAVDKSFRRWLIDLKRFKGTAPEVLRSLAHTCEIFKPVMCFVEANAYQKAMVDWAEELVKSLPIQGYVTGEQKSSVLVGVRSLALEVKKGLWCFPNVTHDITCRCGFCVLFKEMSGYPFYTTDDCVMSWWFAREAYRLYGDKRSPSISIWEY